MSCIYSCFMLFHRFHGLIIFNLVSWTYGPGLTLNLLILLAAPRSVHSRYMMEREMPSGTATLSDRTNSNCAAWIRIIVIIQCAFSAFSVNSVCSLLYSLLITYHLFGCKNGSTTPGAAWRCMAQPWHLWPQRAKRGQRLHEAGKRPSTCWGSHEETQHLDMKPSSSSGMRAKCFDVLWYALTLSCAVDKPWTKPRIDQATEYNQPPQCQGSKLQGSVGHTGGPQTHYQCCLGVGRCRK